MFAFPLTDFLFIEGNKFFVGTNNRKLIDIHVHCTVVVCTDISFHLLSSRKHKALGRATFANITPNPVSNDKGYF